MKDQSSRTHKQSPNAKELSSLKTLDLDQLQNIIGAGGSIGGLHFVPRYVELK